ncbi:hypothetical protein CsatB_010750 [Cannabis sativa]
MHSALFSKLLPLTHHLTPPQSHLFYLSLLQTTNPIEVEKTLLRCSSPSPSLLRSGQALPLPLSFLCRPSSHKITLTLSFSFRLLLNILSFQGEIMKKK